MEFLTFLIQPRNGVGLSCHRVEKLEGRTGWELAGRADTGRGVHPKLPQQGRRWAKQLVNWIQGIFGDQQAGGRAKRRGLFWGLIGHFWAYETAVMKTEQEDSWILSSDKAAGGTGASEVLIGYNFLHCWVAFLASIGNGIISHPGEILARGKQDSCWKNCSHFKLPPNIHVTVLNYEGTKGFSQYQQCCPSKMLCNLAVSGLLRRGPWASKFGCELTASNVSFPNDCTERYCKGWPDGLMNKVVDFSSCSVAHLCLPFSLG